LLVSEGPVVFGFFAQRGFWIVALFVAAGVLLNDALIWTFLIDPELSVVDAPASP
jgi:hypothetical protein